ncbi:MULTISPECIES: DEAD/DEAH box helicase [Clostridium]|uniref:DEAD/DEAH box helicase n=1 Tax=Clostridium TaxID=1485 RepID=UPI000DFC951F|nr:DEAD/DEAH box helicase [Clostridium sporogenes]MCW6084351.1 DEAD/DEAH box helicase [Clostridium sporogenes]STC73749.1 DNA repair helicase Rad25 [Clostridium botulinum]
MDMITKNKMVTITDNIEFKSIENVNDNLIRNEILKASETGLVNKLIDSNLALTPKLVVNDYSKGSKVLSEIISELNKCEEFFISVAFITNSGILPLLETLKVLKKKGVKGKILTTDYLNFSEPKALKKLLEFPNIEMKLYSKENFHTKGYIFRYKDHYKLIVGSSNLTQTALTKNKEWNLKVSSLEEGSLTEGVISEFNQLWNDADELTIKWIETYEGIYRKQVEFARKSKVPRLSQYKLKPNKMQVEAIQGLEKLRENGQNKGLLISATGTGKTYLSAFELRNYNPKRALFIVHREQIAKQALDSFSNVFGDTRSMGILSGTSKDVEKDFIFCTIQTLSKDEVLQSFGKNKFDYIIIDEVHKAGANSYQKIVNYFNPKFLLGMTATPERSDDFDIFKMFNYNIAYEIRLQQALEEDLLCPFHYFGVSDVTIDGIELDDKTDFKYLVAEERVKHIIDKINFYGYCGERVKGLIFCSDKKEAKELSDIFNKKGYKTVFLTGENSQEERETAIERLEQDETLNSLDYIFTVDIFNEGIDIPSVNQVVMLRPTKSSIVFVQQLGRGLRKNKFKEYVVIIDFVGNYNSNFLIPVALSGDRTFNKDTIRKYVMEGTRVIPGCSTINFDEISKKKIFESIDLANFNNLKLIKESYFNLKQKIGRIPSLNDFDNFDSIDPLRIFSTKLGSYYNFLKKYDKEYDVELNDLEALFIEFISKKLASGKRPHELIMIKNIIHNKVDLIGELKHELKEMYNIDFKQITETNVINVLTNEFPTGSAKKTYSKCIFLERQDNCYIISKGFKKCIENSYFKEMVMELIDFGLSRYNKNYSNRYMNTKFQLYQKYTYEDVCRLLEWEHGEVALNIGGYKYDKITRTYPVFINYDKSDDIENTINYEDRFESESQLIAISKSGRTIQSQDIVQAYNAEKDGVEMTLFVRKNKDDKISKEFYFLGKIKAVGKPNQFTMKNTTKTAVEIRYKLITPVREDIYDYIIS